MRTLYKCAGQMLIGGCLAVIAFTLVPVDVWGAWEKGVLDSGGNVGSYAHAVIASSGNIHVVYCCSDTKVVKVMSRISGVWQTPETPDGSGQVEGHCAIAVDGLEARRVSYQRGAALWFAGPESADTWNKGVVLSTPNNVGPYLLLRNAPDDGLSLSCQNVTLGALIFLMRDAVGAWSAPTTVDAGPGRGYDSDHIYRPGAGYAFCERDYYDDMLLYADPVIAADTWAKGTVLATSDNAGPYLSLRNAPGGGLSLSCQNATQRSLIFLARNALGAWSAPVTVDGGPNRGYDSDHVYRPGAGYAFSERDYGEDMLLFADPVLGTNAWTTGALYEGGENGPNASLARLPAGGGVACAFYHYDDVNLGAVYNTFVYGVRRGTVTVVTDSIANYASSDVALDLAVSSALDFGISYRNLKNPALCCAMADSSIVVAIGDPLDPRSWIMRAQLHQNAPNPFNPSTRIQYEVPAGGGRVTIRIFDVAGRLVRTLVDRRETPGVKTVEWDGANESENPVASGVYFCRMEATGFEKTVKVTLVR